MRIPEDHDMGEPLRRPGPCWSCGHTKIVRCQVREETSVQNRQVLRRLPLTRGATTKTVEGPRASFEQAVVFHLDQPQILDVPEDPFDILREIRMPRDQLADGARPLTIRRVDARDQQVLEFAPTRLRRHRPALPRRATSPGAHGHETAAA